MAQLCVQAIANLNWKHFGSGSYKGHIEDIYSEQAVYIINYFDPSDDDCEYLSDCLSDQSHYGASNYCYHHYQSMLETERNEKTLTFQLFTWPILKLRVTVVTILPLKTFIHLGKVNQVPGWIPFLYR